MGETTTGETAPQPLEYVLAPAPIIDRFPTVIGQNLTLTYLSSVFRLATQGLRGQFVDALNELLEHDPHARGAVRQRVVGVAGARLRVYPAALPKNDPDVDLSKEIADDIQAQIENIPKLTQALSALQWGKIYGVSAVEIDWHRDDQWSVTGLRNVHSRRLSYPCPTSWDLYVWDQGAFGSWAQGPVKRSMYGLRIADFPGKFIVHAPQLNGDYATRDGEGRYIAFYMALKRMIVRASAHDFERTIRPWVVGYFKRDPAGRDVSTAGKEDVATLGAAVRALGVGSLNSAVLSDACEIKILRAASNMSVQDFLEFLNAEICKAVVGQTYTMEPGKFGAKGTSDIGKQTLLEILRYDAKCLSDDLEAGLVRPLVRLRHPGASMRLAPRIELCVDNLPDPQEVMDLAVKATSINVPVDVDKLGELTGVPVVAPDDEDARRTKYMAPEQATPPPAGPPGSPVAPDAETETETIQDDLGAIPQEEPLSEAAE